MASTRALVAGATGYIGRRLVTELVDEGHVVRCLARNPAKLSGEVWSDAVEIVRADLLDRESLADAFTGIEVAYYLVHSLAGGDDFEAHDERRVEALPRHGPRARACGRSSTSAVSAPATPTISHPISVRAHEVGRILAGGPVPVTELRAAVIIGSGSASFEMLRNLAEVLPAMVTPKWVDTRCQPITIRDVLGYLIGVLDDERTFARIFEIGGADVLTYREMMQVFADEAGLKRRIIVPVPVLSPRLSSLWIGLVTPLPVALARTLVESLVNEVVVHDHAIDAIVPRVTLPYRQAVRLALRRVADLDVQNRVGPTPTTRPPIRCRRIRTGPAARCSPTSRRSTWPRRPRPCSRPCAASAGSAVGSSRIHCGACGAPSTAPSVASGCGAAAATRTSCGWVTRSTSGASKRSSPTGCSACARR